MKGKITITLLLAVFLAAGLSSSLWAQAPYDTVSIHDLQFVTDPIANDASPFLGDTVVVQGLVMTGPRDLWVGNRWSAYIIDPNQFPNPWSGFFIIQNDTTANGAQTGMGFIEPGMIVNFTGPVSEFARFSQVVQLTANPLVPVDIVSVGNPLPAPVLLTAADLADRATAEQWESMWARIENTTVVNNSIAGNWASITDPSAATTFIAEYTNWFRDRLNAGTYSWPQNGTNLNVDGFTRDESGSPGQVFTVNPRDTFDLEILTNPPQITNVQRNPGVPTSSNSVNVSANIVDNGTVVSATLHYSAGTAPFQDLAMSPTGDVWDATIPAQSNGTLVRYFLSAIDNNGQSSTLPGDTSRATGRVFFYTVRDGGLTIADVQGTQGYASDISGYLGYSVTLQGVVMTDSTDFVGDYYIQDAAAPWSGIWVNNDPNTYLKGDEVTVTGTVEENFNVTRLNNITASSLVTPGVGEFAPVVVTTGSVTTGGPDAEAFESVLVRVENLTVTNPFPDAPSNFGEFTVDDGSGGIRVDDLASAFRGNLDSTFALNDPIQAIVAFGYFSFGNAKLIPRNDNDIIGHLVGIGDEPATVPEAFSLEQNFPNPFNPSTVVRYSIDQSGEYRLVVYNVLGQQVKVLAAGRQSAGIHNVTWDGRNDNGQLVTSGIYLYRLSGNGKVLTRKMILLK